MHVQAVWAEPQSFFGAVALVAIAGFGAGGSLVGCVCSPCIGAPGWGHFVFIFVACQDDAVARIVAVSNAPLSNALRDCAVS